MSTFCTTTALDTVMIGTTFDSQTTALAAKCIVWAEDEIKKRLSRRYDISAATFQTATSIPPMVRTWCEWLSQGYLEQNLYRGGPEGIARGTVWIERVMDNLKDVESYKVNITDTVGAAITESSNTAYSVLSNTDDYNQTFDEDSPLDWSLDTDKLTAIDDGRD